MADEKDLPESLQDENIKDPTKGLDPGAQQRDIELLKQRTSAYNDVLESIRQIKIAEVDLFANL